MTVLKRIFGSMNRQYIVRAYVIGLAFFTMIGLSIDASASAQTISVFVYIMMALNTLLFPFAKIVWDSLKGFVLGDTIIVQGLGVHFVMKYLINGILWSLATFVAPIGIIYILNKSKPF